MQRADAVSEEPGLGKRITLASAALLLIVFGVLTVRLARSVAPLADEAKYFNAGRYVLVQGWDHYKARLQGPLPLYGSQLFVDDFPAGGFAHTEAGDAAFFRGRLGTLPFALLCAVLVFWVSRRAFGNTGGLLALLLFTLNPLMLAYGGVVLVDMHLAAAVLFAGLVLWGLLERPTWPRVVLLGVALALAAATKYSAVVYTLPLVPLALVSMARAGKDADRPVLRGTARALGALVVLALAAFVALYACYGFRVGSAPASPDAYGSALVANLVRTPVLGTLASWLPEPLLLGIDYQKEKADGGIWVFLNGSFAQGHPGYYLWTLLTKTPEIVLVLTAWLLMARGPAWIRGSCAARERTLVLALGGMILFGLAYLSFFTSSQLGVRYVLPVFPLAFCLLGAAGRTERMRSLSPARQLGMLAVVGALLAWDLWRSWPNVLAYYNTASGGQAQSYHRFRDSNGDFGQLRWAGLDMLRAAETESFAVLGKDSGPRFGRVAIALREFRSRDRRDDTRPRFGWLDPIDPVNHAGASWWLFDVTPEPIERELERRDDPLLREDLVIAYLGEGRLRDAERHLELLSPERTGRVRPLAELLEETAVPFPDAAKVRALVPAWRRVGRPDLVEELVNAHPALEADPNSALWLAEAMVDRMELQEALAFLKEREAELTPLGRLLLVRLCLDARRFRDAEEVLAPLLRSAPDDREVQRLARQIEVRKDVDERFRAPLR